MLTIPSCKSFRVLIKWEKQSKVKITVCQHLLRVNLSRRAFLLRHVLRAAPSCLEGLTILRMWLNRMSDNSLLIVRWVCMSMDVWRSQTKRIKAQRKIEPVRAIW